MAPMTLIDRVRTTTTLVEVPPKHWRWSPPSTPEAHPDAVELSEHARWMHELATLPPARLQLIERIRGQIEQGVYETDQKIDAAANRLAQELLEAPSTWAVTR